MTPKELDGDTNDAIDIANGGTNATTAAQALTNLGGLAASGGTVTNLKETLYYKELTADYTVGTDSAADVQYYYVNPAGASVAITLPADPGAVGKSLTLFIKNNTGKAHTWNTSPNIEWVGETDSDTVPTPAAVTYVSIYTFTWFDNNAGTGFWCGWLAGKETA